MIRVEKKKHLRIQHRREMRIEVTTQDGRMPEVSLTTRCKSRECISTFT